MRLSIDKLVDECK